MYYLIGSFLAFVVVVDHYYSGYYSKYEEPDIELIIEEHPESKYWFIISALTSWVFLIVYFGIKLFRFINTKTKK